MSAGGPAGGLHLGRVVLGALMVLLAGVVLLDVAGLARVPVGLLGPVALLVAGVALLVTAAGRTRTPTG